MIDINTKAYLSAIEKKLVKKNYNPAFYEDLRENSFIFDEKHFVEREEDIEYPITIVYQHGNIDWITPHNKTKEHILLVSSSKFEDSTEDNNLDYVVNLILQVLEDEFDIYARVNKKTMYDSNDINEYEITFITGYCSRC